MSDGRNNALNRPGTPSRAETADKHPAVRSGPNRDLVELENAVKQLKMAYEKYFAGIERIEPMQQHDKVKKQLRSLQAEGRTGTARRFKLQNIQASLVTHEAYWTRICRQIEEGTHKRDRLRASKRMGEQVAAKNKERPAKAAKQEYSKEMVALHTAYQKAQLQVGASNKVSVAALAKTVAKQTAALKKRYNCDRVDFKVAVKGDKVILKAVPT